MLNSIDEAAAITDMQMKLEVAESAISELVLRIEDTGWGKFDSVDENGIKLSVLHRMTEHHNDLVSANPIIGRAVRVRAAYVFGQGLEIQETNKTDVTKNVIKQIKSNSNVFTKQEQHRLENTATSTGNVFMLVSGKGRQGRIVTVPISQIVAYVSEPDPIDGVMMYVREYTSTENGTKTKHKIAYLTENSSYASTSVTIGKETIPVEQSARIIHVRFNAIDEWIFGVPDLYGTSFWASAHKKALESDMSMKEALSKFAWKVTAQTRQGVNKAATQVANTPGVAGVAAMTDGNQLSAINRSGANVNFNENWPLAAIVAAGFDIPLNELLYQTGASSSNELSETNAFVLGARQEIWCEALEAAFRILGVPVNIVAPRLFSEPVHRVAQAISVLANTNLLHPSELREAAILQLKRYGVQSFENTLPDAGAWSEYAQGLTDNPGTTPLNTPDNSKTADQRTPGGALADGDNELRNQQ